MQASTKELVTIDSEDVLEDIALAKRFRIPATTIDGILTIDNKKKRA